MRRMSCVLIASGMLSWGTPVQCAGLFVGAKGGLNLANLTGEDVHNNSSSDGAIAGAFGRYDLSNVFSLQLETLYTMRGAEFSVGDIETEQRIDYIEVPVLARAAWHNDSKFEPSLLAGPTVGFLLENEISDGADIDLEDASTSTDFGLVVGAGLDYALGGGAIVLDARYEHGLTSWSDDLDEKHKIASFMLGYGHRM